MSEGVSYLITITLVFPEVFVLMGITKAEYVSLVKAMKVLDGRRFLGIVFDAYVIDEDTYQVCMVSNRIPIHTNPVMHFKPGLTFYVPSTLIFLENTPGNGMIESCVPIPNHRQRLARQIGIY